MGHPFDLEPLEPRTLLSAVLAPSPPTAEHGPAIAVEPYFFRRTVRAMPADSLTPIAPAFALIGLDRFRADPRFADLRGQFLTAAVIDTGIDLASPAFGPDADFNAAADRIVSSIDFADHDASAQDAAGHGTHVASVIAGASDLGVAQHASIAALKVFSDSGSGSMADVELALQWVIANAKTRAIAAVNLSFGDSGAFTTPQAMYSVSDELATLATMGVIVVAASGNAYTSLHGLAYPAADANVIAVGAVFAHAAGPLSWQSGATADSARPDAIAPFAQRTTTLPMIFAPGVAIQGAAVGGGQTTMDGTSAAAPIVTGAAILAQQLAQRSLGRALTTAEFRWALEQSSTLIIDGDDERDNALHTGGLFRRLDVFALAERILTMGPALTATPTLFTPTTIFLTFTPVTPLSSGWIVPMTAARITTLDAVLSARPSTPASIL